MIFAYGNSDSIFKYIRRLEFISGVGRSIISASLNVEDFVKDNICF